MENSFLFICTFTLHVSGRAPDCCVDTVCTANCCNYLTETLEVEAASFSWASCSVSLLGMYRTDKCILNDSFPGFSFVKERSHVS